MYQIRFAGMVLLLMAAVPLAAQVQSRPTDPPIVTAVNESWYQLREPLQFAGDLYFPAGAAVFFNGNTMVRTGHYNGIPLYADTTLEPYSIVFVPIGGGVMQPYERLRRGELAGTTGSRPPSFPVPPTPESLTMIAAAAPPTAPPLPIGAISVYTAETPTRAEATGATVGTLGTLAAPAPLQSPRPFVTVRRPEGNIGIWVEFGGARWVSSGPAISVGTIDLVPIGEYAGFPVYARRTSRDVIYLPTRQGIVAPYKRER
jgi:hypothetical protein